MADEALADECLERVELRARDLLRRLKGAPACEDGQPGEEATLGVVEQLVAPVDGRAQRLLAWVEVACSAKEIEPAADALEDLRRRQDGRARRRELDGEGQAVERVTQAGDRLIRGETRALSEESYRIGRRQRRHVDLNLIAEPEALAARRENVQVRAPLDELRHCRRGGQQPLEVVEEEKQLAIADVRDEVVLRAENARDCLKHEVRFPERRKTDPEDARLELRHQLGCSLERESCLPRTARAGEGDETRAAADTRHDFGDVCLAAYEGARRSREVMPPRRRRRGDFLPQHRFFQPTQLLPGLQAQLGGQHVPGPPVGCQRIGLPFAPVQRQHQQPPQPLPQRMLCDQALQLPGHLRVQPELDVGLDPALHRRQPQLLQPGRLPRQRLHLTHIGQRRAVPQPQRLPETSRRRRRVIPAQRRLP